MKEDEREGGVRVDEMAIVDVMELQAHYTRNPVGSTSLTMKEGELKEGTKDVLAIQYGYTHTQRHHVSL